MAALAITWIFNDLLWAMTVLRTDAKFPITPALLNLQGGFITLMERRRRRSADRGRAHDVVFFAFQTHFVSGLLVGANK